MKQKENKIPQIQITDTSYIEFVPLFLKQESDGRFLIGVEGTNRSFHVSNKVGKMVSVLMARRNIKTAAILLRDLWPQKKLEELLSYLRDIVFQFLDLKLVQSVDGRDIIPRKIESSSSKKFSLARVGWGLFLIGGGLFNLFVLYLMFTKHQYFPRSEDLFWHERNSISIITSFLLGWIFLLKHELSHLLTAKVFGADGDISLGRRLYFLVAETKLVNLFKLTRWQRIFVFLAGMWSDLWVFSLSLFALWLHDIGIWLINPMICAILEQIILLEWMSILWQFMFFMRTDIYFVLSEIFRCDNLMKTSKKLVRNFVVEAGKLLKLDLKKNKLTLADVFPKEIKVARVYAWFFIIGTALAIIKWTLYDFPILLSVFVVGFRTLMYGIQNDNLIYIVDGYIPLALKSVQQGLLVYVFWKGKKFRSS